MGISRADGLYRDARTGDRTLKPDHVLKVEKEEEYKRDVLRELTATRVLLQNRW